MCLSARHKMTVEGMHRYRTHTCGALRAAESGQVVRVNQQESK